MISQPRGLSGTPSRRPLPAAASSASWTASSAMSKCPYRRTNAPRTCGASVAQQVLDGVIGHVLTSAARFGVRAESSIDRSHVDVLAPRRHRARVGHLASRAAISVARSKLSHSTIV